MSQDSNTTNDTNPKPPLRMRQPEGAPPANAEPSAPAGSKPSALPRLSFAPKKRADEVPPAHVPPPPEAPAQPLKRPPHGTRLVPSGDASGPREMPAPLTPIMRSATAAPFAGSTPKRSRGNFGLLAIMIVLVLIVGGESAFILMRDEETEAGSKIPMLVKERGPSGATIEVLNDGAPPPTPAYAYLQGLNPEVASGALPRLFIGGRMFHIGEVIAPEFGLKWIQVDDKTRELEFVDKQGRRYIKKF